MDLGATVVGDRTVRFRVWAPRCRSLEVEVRSVGRFPLEREVRGYFSGTVDGIQPGTAYRYWLNGSVSRPDPVSRFLPSTVHDWSQIVDPTAYRWRDAQWRGVPRDELVIYELHVGTFSDPGTYAGARDRMAELVELGVTAIELMPLAESPGRWNWGYDGVSLFAPRRTYGSPDDLRALVDHCHELGIAVLLDVVYNHLGPEGNYLNDFGPYFTSRHHTPWGPALNFDGRHRYAVREYIVQNALYWINEFHLDGLRLDAVHFMVDDQRPPIAIEVCEALTNRAEELGRLVHVIGETNVYDAELLRDASPSGVGFDAIWCDDAMHSLMTIVHPERQLTTRSYHGLSDLAESLTHGYLYTGPQYARVRKTDQSPTVDMSRLIAGLQNHDVIGNHPLGERLAQQSSAEFQRAAAAIFLLAPTIPMLFMGEEFACAAPFLFFVDFTDASLRRAVERGRAREYPQHSWRKAISPLDDQAFLQSKIGAADQGDLSMRAWYQQLLRTRTRWRRSGTLRQANLRMRVSESTQLLVIQYVGNESRPAFVVVRLARDGSDRTSVPVPIDGELVLDSLTLDSTLASENRMSGYLELQPQHAVVGYGMVADLAE